MEKVTVNKAELLARVEANRADHRRIFEEALNGFWAAAQAELTQMLNGVKAGRRSSIYVTLQVPQDHTGSYDRAIGMIKMAIGDTITLSERDFAQYVMDDWGWQKAFVRNSYGSQTASGKFSDYLVSDD